MVFKSPKTFLLFSLVSCNSFGKKLERNECLSRMLIVIDLQGITNEKANGSKLCE